ncbi:MAG: T9SS type A sorting domain-containing protein [Candidatus Eisenbacteria bacterium]
MRYDGKYLGDPSDFATYDEYYAWVRSTFDSLLTITSPVRIDVLYNSITADSDSVYVSFDVVVEDSMDFNSTLRVAVTESKHRYPYPTGPHDDAFREWVKDDLPDSVGWSFGPMFPGKTMHFDMAYEIVSEYRADRVVTNVFIQRSGTRKMQNGWSGEPTPYLAGVDVVEIPVDAILGRSSPNPFVGNTNISFNVKRPGKVSLGVYTLTGRLVTELVNGYAEVGPQSVAWDGKDRFGQDVASGVYYYILETENASQAGKMIRLR